MLVNKIFKAIANISMLLLLVNLIWGVIALIGLSITSYVPFWINLASIATLPVSIICVVFWFSVSDLKSYFEYLKNLKVV